MGIDFLDLQFRLEKEFRIKLAREGHFSRYLESGNGIQRLPTGGGDILVRDFVDGIVRGIEEQNPVENVQVFDRVKKHIVVCLSCDEAKVIPEAWMVRDLGMN